jgi:acyl carrier protein
MAGTDMIERVRTWLMARKPEITKIGLDEDLIDGRVIDSVAFVEFLLFLEDLVGHDIALTEQNAVVFRTLRGINDHILSGARQ